MCTYSPHGEPASAGPWAFGLHSNTTASSFPALHPGPACLASHAALGRPRRVLLLIHGNWISEYCSGESGQRWRRSCWMEMGAAVVAQMAAAGGRRYKAVIRWCFLPGYVKQPRSSAGRAPTAARLSCGSSIRSTVRGLRCHTLPRVL